MINVIHAPRKCADNNFRIEGNDIHELVEFCLTKIRDKSRPFYRKELTEDLTLNGKSIIDHRAGMGYYYDVVLNSDILIE